MITSPRFLAGRAIALVFVLIAGTTLGAAVAWLWAAMRAGDLRAFWILYVVAMIAVGVAVFSATVRLLRARAELARRRGEHNRDGDPDAEDHRMWLRGH